MCDANFPRARLAECAGLHGAFAFPIHLGEHVLGVIEFFSREIRQPNQEVLEMFSAIGGQIGQFIERKRAEYAIRQLNTDLERRVAEATRGLRESQERFSKAFRASPVCISIERQSDGRFVEVNGAFLQASGYSRENVIGRNSAELGIWSNLEDRGAFLLRGATPGVRASAGSGMALEERDASIQCCSRRNSSKLMGTARPGRGGSI